jgi:hypothetical protein
VSVATQRAHGLVIDGAHRRRKIRTTLFYPGGVEQRSNGLSGTTFEHQRVVEPRGAAQAVS